MRISTAALVLLAPLTGAAACTVLNDMDSYASGGLADTGVQAQTDTGTKVDTATPTDSGNKDTSAPDTGTTPDTGTADTGTVPDTGMPLDTSMPMDTGMDTSMADTSVMDTMKPETPVGCHVVINEVQTRGTATAGDEFIELYNPCSMTIDLSGYRLVYRSASNTTDVTVALIASGKTIAPSGFFLVGNGSYASTSDQPFTASGIADDGAAAIRDASTAQLDSVAWGSVVAGHSFLEGTTAAPKPTAGASISRVPNGTDTDSNSADFKPTTSTPKM